MTALRPVSSLFQAAKVALTTREAEEVSLVFQVLMAETNKAGGSWV